MLRSTYNQTISMFESKSFFGCNLNKLSKILKLEINRGLGPYSDNKVLLNSSIDEFRLITGQHPKYIFSKKSIAGFKLREKTLIGLKVTLRNKPLFYFLDRLIHLVIPQISDFSGFSIKHFDTFGNYNFGFCDQLIFPEISYDKIIKPLGFNLSIHFSSTNIFANKRSLEHSGFLFQ